MHFLLHFEEGGEMNSSEEEDKFVPALTLVLDRQCVMSEE